MAAIMLATPLTTAELHVHLGAFDAEGSAAHALSQIIERRARRR